MGQEVALFALSWTFAEHRTGGHGNLGIGLLVMVIVEGVKVLVATGAHGTQSVRPGFDTVLFGNIFDGFAAVFYAGNAGFFSSAVANLGFGSIEKEIKANQGDENTHDGQKVNETYTSDEKQNHANEHENGRCGKVFGEDEPCRRNDW